MDSDFLTFLVVLVAAWLILRSILRVPRKRRGHRGPWRWDKPRDAFDLNEQLAYVSAVEFERQPLLNKGEYRVLLVLEAAARDARGGYRVMAQTSLGEVLRPKLSVSAEQADLAFRSINSKRADFIVVDRRGLAVLAVEYQGNGHYQGNAEQRDAVKRAVFQSAGVMLIEVPAQFNEAALATQVRQSLSQVEN